MNTTPQGIDRDALLRYLRTEGLKDSIEQVADRILALVRPVEGVTLTREEARHAATCVRMVREGAVSDPHSAAELDALAARLEAAQ